MDEQVVALLRGDAGVPARTIATAESCTGGLLAAHLTDLPGASAYMYGGIVAYANGAKVGICRRPRRAARAPWRRLTEVAEAAGQKGARELLGADVGEGITGVAGPAAARRRSRSARSA